MRADDCIFCAEEDAVIPSTVLLSLPSINIFRKVISLAWRLLAILAVSSQTLTAPIACAHSNNELAIGNQAAQINHVDGLKNNQLIDIAINAPQDLNYKTKTEVLSMRTELVDRYTLLRRAYEPTNDVFDSIVDSRPWWGMRGDAVWGPGPRSIEGPAEESRFFLNPYLLVAANPYTAEMWNESQITDADLDRADFPYTWLPTSLSCTANDAVFEVHYPVTAYNKQLYLFKEKLKNQKIAPQFALVAYNARDFGYNWIWVSPEKSVNIESLRKPRDVTRIEQMIHCGGTCGISGGCNNMSPSQPNIDEMAYTALPARAQIFLWKEKPRDIQQPPDCTVVLVLE